MSEHRSLTIIVRCANGTKEPVTMKVDYPVSKVTRWADDGHRLHKVGNQWVSDCGPHTVDRIGDPL